MKNKLFNMITVLVVLLFSCKKSDEVSFDYKYTPPTEISDGLEVSTLSEAGINENKLREMMDAINATSDHRIHSLLIMKDNKLIFEEYFQGYAFSYDPYASDGEWMQYDKDVEHFLASVTKSVTSTLVGIAIDKGYINSVDDKVADYFPEYADIMTGEKANITIKQMLTMSSGFPWDETTYPNGHSLNDHSYLFTSEDPIKWVLERPLEHNPGTIFHYNSGTTNVLAAIVEKSSGLTLEQFIDQFLFEPIGITNADYLFEVFQSGGFFASGGLWMSARELCKIGSLYTNAGKWEDSQIISPNWIQEAQQSHIVLPSYYTHSDAYGYQWWKRIYNVGGESFSSFSALGWGEQSMTIFPDENLIVQFYCGYYKNPPYSELPRQLIQQYILPALQ